MIISRKIWKTLAVVLCLCIVLSCMPWTALAADDGGCSAIGCSGVYANGFCSSGKSHYQRAEENASGVYEISNGGQLFWFAKLVDGGDTSANAVLTADIVVNQSVLVDGELNPDEAVVDEFYTWNPIGSNNKKYQGCFDGANHTICGLYYDNDSTLGAYIGLFATLGETAVVKNVKLADSYIYAKGNCGAIAGSNAGGTIENCANTAVIAASGSNVGGITGHNNGGKLADCTNSGTVIGENENVGGIAGTISNEATVERCCNTGAVTGDGNRNESYVGGIVGRNENGTTISDCYNTGDISSDGEYSGGIVGVAYGSNIINCYNTGAVSGKSAVGSIVGGHYSEPFIRNCYYLAASETDIYGNTTAVSSDRFASGEVAYLLNGAVSSGDTLAWFQNIDAQDAEPDDLPVLDNSHGIVYYGHPNCTDAFGYTNTEPVEGENGPHKDENGDGLCDFCGEPVEIIPDPSQPDESDPTDPSKPDESDPTDPSQPGESDPTDPSQPGESDPTDPSKPDDNDPPEPSKPECPKDQTCILSRYSDIVTTEWYHDGVHYCVEEGLMNGMTDTTFEPATNTSRAMLVTMLYRMEGKPSIDGMTEPFSDVTESDWFYAPIVWAYNNKVVNGMTETTFEPNTNVSREQVATIMHRYNGTPAGIGDLSGFPDVASVSAYAKDALAWAVGEGLINGVAQSDGTSALDPTGNATRAQIATILMRYLTA